MCKGLCLSCCSGRPYIRCLTCKSRRVKCDTTRPTCARCSKAGRDCVWDDAECDLPIKSENSFAKGQPRRPRKWNAQILQSRCNLPKPYNPYSFLEFSPEVCAFQYWKENLASWPDYLFDIGQEYGASACQHWHCEDESGSSLRLAVSAFSLAVFGRAKRSGEALQRAEIFYARSITQLRRELQILSNDRIDQLLIATMMLATYDNMMFASRLQKSENLPISTERNRRILCGTHTHHQNGTASLLQVRQQRRFTHNVPLDRALRRPLIRACLSLGEPVQAWLQDDALHAGKDRVLALDYLMIEAASLRSKSIQLLGGMNAGTFPSADTLKMVIAEAQLLDYSFAEWTRDIPQEWSFLTQKSLYHGDELHCNKRSSLLYDKSCHSYTTHGHAAVWNRYRAVHLLVNSIRMQLLAVMDQDTFGQSDSDLLTQSRACQNAMDCLATDLCRSIPFFYQSDSTLSDKTRDLEPSLNAEFLKSSQLDIKPMMAVLLAWPLSIAVSIEEVPLKQREWLKCRLKAVNEVIGSPTLGTLSEVKFRARIQSGIEKL